MTQPFNLSTITSQVEGKTPWLTIFFVTIVFVFATGAWNVVLGRGPIEGGLDRFALEASGSLLRRVIFSALGLYGVISLMSPGPPRYSISGLLAWSIVFLVVWSFVSVLWTADFELTARRLVAFAAFGLGALGLARKLSPRDVGMVFLVSAGILAFLNLLAELDRGDFSPFDPDYRFTGVEHPNQQGMYCSFIVLSAVMLGDSSDSRKRLLYFIAGAGLVFLVLTKSRTSFAATMISLVVYKQLVANPSRQVRVALAAVLVLLASIFALGESAIPIIGSGAHLGRNTGDIETLNGRIWLWMECRGFLADRPVIGYGFNGFWSPDRMDLISNRQGWILGEAHNTYIDVALSLGFVGLFAYLGIVVFAVLRSRWAFRETGQHGYAFMYAFLVFYALHGLLESNFIRTGYASFMSMLVIASLAYSTEIVKHLAECELAAEIQE